MTKREKEKYEREKLKQMIENNPKLKSFLDAMIDNPSSMELKEIIEPVLADTFEKIRMKGVWTGWYAHASLCLEKAKECKTLEDCVEIFTKEVQMSEQKLEI